MDLQKLTKLINKLLKEFSYENGKLIYNDKKQERISVLLSEIAKYELKSDDGKSVFGTTLEKEKENIEYMSIVDRIDSGGHLVDITSLPSRIEGVLNKNNIYTPLKTLALANKCAHAFDESKKPMVTIKNQFLKYYNIYNPNTRLNNISFIRKLKYSVCKDLISSRSLDKYDISLFIKNDIEFDKFYSTVFGNTTKIKRGTKIHILRNLKINVDPSNTKDIEEKFSMVLNDKNEILKGYLIKKYEEAQVLASLQNKLFAVKDNLIAMIGQLLKDGRVDLNYELVRTENAQSGFECMLIIDDPELSYYIEVHMPEFISRSLINDYGFVVSGRTTKRLGASAVYKRDAGEIKKIKKVLDEGKINEGEKHHSKTRAEVITRGYGNSGDIVEEKQDEEYEFETKMISDVSTIEPITFIKYLLISGKNISEIKENNYLKHNETYSKAFIDNVILDNYYNLYKTLTNKEKIEYIYYAYKNDNKDLFDNSLMKELGKIDISANLDIIGKVLLYKNVIKKNFIAANEYEIDNTNNSYYKNKNKFDKDISSLMTEYIKFALNYDNNYNNNYDKEDENGKRKDR